MFPVNKKGFHDVMGNVWEWCEDNFNGLPGHETSYLYDDFSTPCYDGRHNIIMGGSWVSTGDEASYFARYMFRRHFYQHCGFRLTRSLPTQDGSKPNPQVRLVEDRIFVLGAGMPG
jgi:formylglycine-generating enzyme required for sulfatase activity